MDGNGDVMHIVQWLNELEKIEDFTEGSAGGSKVDKIQPTMILEHKLFAEAVQMINAKKKTTTRACLIDSALQRGTSGPKYPKELNMIFNSFVLKITDLNFVGIAAIILTCKSIQPESEKD